MRNRIQKLVVIHLIQAFSIGVEIEKWTKCVILFTRFPMQIQVESEDDEERWAFVHTKIHSKWLMYMQAHGKKAKVKTFEIHFCDKWGFPFVEFDIYLCCTVSFFYCHSSFYSVFFHSFGIYIFFFSFCLYMCVFVESFFVCSGILAYSAVSFVIRYSIKILLCFTFSLCTKALSLLSTN